MRPLEGNNTRRPRPMKLTKREEKIIKEIMRQSRLSYKDQVGLRELLVGGYKNDYTRN